MISGENAFEIHCSLDLGKWDLTGRVIFGGGLGAENDGREGEKHVVLI